MRVRRGEIVLLDYPYTSGGSKVRPALVVQDDTQNRKLANTFVAMVSSQLKRAAEPMQLVIELASPQGQQSGLRQDSLVNCTRLYTIEQSQVLRMLGTLPPQTMQQIDDCPRKTLAL